MIWGITLADEMEGSGLIKWKKIKCYTTEEHVVQFNCWRQHFRL